MRMIVAIVTIVLTAACSGTAPSMAPTAPSIAPIAPEPAATPAAELEITTFEMKYLRFELGFYVYAPEITLTEKFGRSATRLNPIAGKPGTPMHVRPPGSKQSGLGTG